MKIKGLVIILILLCMPLITAQPVINLQKQNFQPGETLLANITTPGEFAKTISKASDIKFFEGRKEVFFEYDLVFYNNTYFLYMYLNREGNFTIKISDILYKSPELKSITIEKQIEVKEKFIDENKTKTQILSIKPGFVFSSQQPELILKNKGNTILDLTYDSEQISLSPEDFKKISFRTNQIFSYFIVKAYETFNIPVIYVPLISEQNISHEFETQLKSDPSYLQIKMIVKQETIESIEIVNFGEINITNIFLTTNLSVLELPEKELEKVNAKSTEKINLSFYSEESKFFKGSLEIAFVEGGEDKTIAVPIEVYVFPENTTEEGLEVKENSCSELEGVLCSPDEYCTGDATLSSDGYCCLGGTCEAEEDDEENGRGWIVGLGILILLGVIGFLVYKKFRKTTPQKPEEKLKETSKIYEKRIKGKLTRT